MRQQGIKPANGTKGCILHVGGSYWVFRVYKEGGDFKDYDLLHSDLFVIIDDEDSAFYEEGDRQSLDHSPETLGYYYDQEADSRKVR